jgi:uncharacterized protein YjbI with pentapeptide repeats
MDKSPDSPEPDELPPSAAELIELAREGAKQWEKWRKLNGLLELDYQPVFEALLDGQVETPTAQQLMALVKAGPELWNAWRKHNQLFHPSFKNSMFGFEIHDFSLFDLSSVSFAGARFQADMSIDVAKFHNTDFSGTVFQRTARFRGVSGSVRFNGANFAGMVDFSAAILSEVSFDDATFGWLADAVPDAPEWPSAFSFRGAQFLNGASFRRAFFGSHVKGWRVAPAETVFSGAQFSENVCFEGTVFAGAVNFEAWTAEQVQAFWVRTATELFLFRDSQRSRMVRLNHAQERDSFVAQRAIFSVEQKVTSDSFRRISFAGAHFRDEAEFEGRRFCGMTNFGPLPAAAAGHVTIVRQTANGPEQVLDVADAGQLVIFARAPRLYNCLLHRDTNILAAKFQDWRAEGAAAAYRSLKHAMNAQLATKEEQYFYRLEMMAEQHHMKRPIRWLYAAYGTVSDYGLSVKRPMVAIFIVWVVCLLILALLQTPAFLAAAHTSPDLNQVAAVVAYSIVQILPVPGIDETGKQLFKMIYPDPSTLWVAFFSVFNAITKTVNLILFFLLGLGLRNQFKFK